MLIQARIEHRVHGWVSQYCKDDGFSDVLHQMGECSISEEQFLKLQEQEPYIVGTGMASIANNLEHRL